MRRFAGLLACESAICMGYSNACVCTRCTDRQSRSEVYHDEGQPNADSEAKRDSEDYFMTPWRFDSSSPPMRLMSK